MRKLLIILLFPIAAHSQTMAVSIGQSDTAHYLRIANESANFPLPQAGTLLHLISSGITVNPRISMDTYNGANILGSVYQGRRAGGTASSPSACLADYTLVAITADGFGTSSFTGSGIGSISIKAEGTFTNTSKPVYISFVNSPTGSTTAREVMRIKSTGVVNIAGLNSVGVIHSNSSGDLSTALLSSGEVTTALGYTPLQSSDISGKMDKSDSATYYSKYRSDSSRTNLYAAINLRLASVTAAITYAPIVSASLVTPNIGVATGTSLAVSGALTSSSPSAGIGYVTGSGATVTQITNKGTGVTINTISGAITTSNSALLAGAEVKFTVTNSRVSSTDVPVVAVKSGGTSGSYAVDVSAVSAGSFDIVLSNLSLGSLSEAVVINFVIIKASSN